MQWWVLGFSSLSQKPLLAHRDSRTFNFELSTVDCPRGVPPSLRCCFMQEWALGFRSLVPVRKCA
jgi:hypothetical protein